MPASPIPAITLADGATIPQLGLGVYKVPDDEAETVVVTALDAGYRHLDTASFYGNERGVGRAMRASGCGRGVRPLRRSSTKRGSCAARRPNLVHGIPVSCRNFSIWRSSNGPS